MSRIAPKLLAALFVLGCGSGAMASPGRGQWSDSPGAPSPGVPSQGAPPDQGSSQNQDQEEEDLAGPDATATRQGRLGVMVMAVTPELRHFFGVASDRGVLVARVEPGSAAARAGVQVGDVLVRVGPQIVHTGDDVIQALAARPGARVRVSVVRQGRPTHLVAVLTAPGQPNPGNPLGPQQNNQPPSPSQNPL